MNLSANHTPHFSTEEASALGFLGALLDPFALVVSLWIIAIHQGVGLSMPYFILSLIVFLMSFRDPSRFNESGRVFSNKNIVGVTVRWLWVFLILYLFGNATGSLRYFSRDVLFAWLLVAPVGQTVMHYSVEFLASQIVARKGSVKHAVIAGLNKHGQQFGKQIKSNPLLGIELMGFFDDRMRDGLRNQGDFKWLGSLSTLVDYVKENHVDLLYVAMPMASQPRILKLLDELRDTTASIYFIPDVFITDLIQARVAMVGGIPAVAVCETPFAGWNGVIKRASDILLSLLILALILPALLLIALAIKLESPGPVIFHQRRYGLDGREIIVYKFRSMKVCEDSDTIIQARKDDPRLTRIGAFLRRTSLDELPQFINVLQGRMSIVGPRPHAVAHNEMYRKVIKSYMIRHKVKPGITGWAQVNGMRGETETLEKMKARIDYDLDYLRNWALWLDLYIILKTVLVVFKDFKKRQAY